MNKILITTGVVAVAGGIATVLLMPSCEPDCDVHTKPSVIVKLVDPDAASATLTQVAADEVWYEWTDEDGTKVEKKAECMDDECTEWMLGDGAPGTFEYHAKVCGKQFDASVTVDYNKGGCEVDTQLVDLTVSTVDCPQLKAPDLPEPPQNPSSWGVPTWKAPPKPTCSMEAHFSVVASLYTKRGDGLGPVGADRAYFIYNPAEGEDGPGKGKGLGHDKHKGEGHEKGKGKGHDGDGEVDRGEEIPAMCLDEACTRFGAGLELEGTILVGAEACGQIREVTVEVSKTPDGCHVITQPAILEFDGVQCKAASDVDAPPPPKAECPSTMPAPSAYVWPVYQDGDMIISQPTTGLIWTNGETRGEGYCAVPAANDKCALWIPGWGRTGEFTVYTATCGHESAISFTVEPAEDGCGPDTKYVLAMVDTHGCLKAPTWGNSDNSGPDVPVAGEDVKRNEPEAVPVP